MSRSASLSSMVFVNGICFGRRQIPLSVPWISGMWFVAMMSVCDGSNSQVFSKHRRPRIRSPPVSSLTRTSLSFAPSSVSIVITSRFPWRSIFSVECPPAFSFVTSSETVAFMP